MIRRKVPVQINLKTEAEKLTTLVGWIILVQKAFISSQS